MKNYKNMLLKLFTFGGENKIYRENLVILCNSNDGAKERFILLKIKISTTFKFFKINLFVVNINSTQYDNFRNKDR